MQSGNETKGGSYELGRIDELQRRVEEIEKREALLVQRLKSAAFTYCAFLLVVAAGVFVVFVKTFG